MVDLDNFREINRQSGWTSADRALQKFVRIARSHLRETDWVARWGGEEFLIDAGRGSEDRTRSGRTDPP
jgi:diguanylate cyclase (GGDEF)-like protein